MSLSKIHYICRKGVKQLVTSHPASMAVLTTNEYGTIRRRFNFKFG